jgi:exo-1,4-beta-D-glucosaminidase
LNDGNGKAISDNFYWLSAKPDLLDEKGTDWYYTPNKAFADFKALNKLPTVSLQVEQQWIENGVTVTLSNPGPHIAFFIELKLVDGKTGRSVLPVFWDDNYVSVLPGETKRLTARYWIENLRGLSERPVLWYSGWNVKETRTSSVSSASSHGSKIPDLKEESLHGTK